MMKSVRQIFLIICLLAGARLGSHANPAIAGDSQVPRSLLGLWAHSEADCQVKLSGQLDRDGRGNWQNTDYEFVAFCKNGMELLYQPIFCAADKVEASSAGYNYSGRCRVKDYPSANLAFKIRTLPTGGISFNEQEFENSDFSISGDYVRCALSYKCEGHLEEK